VGPRAYLNESKWADVDITDLHSVAECTCGCRSVVLEKLPKPQNPKLVGHQGLVGRDRIDRENSGTR
jgi:hypothetical protein